MNEGYIKLYRSILDNPIVCKNAEHFAVWIYLLLNATHSEQKVIFDGKKITLKKGQLITGRKRIAEFLSLDESKVQRILRALEREQQIEQQTCNKNRLITVLNWSKYQFCEHQIEQQVNNTFDDFCKNENEKSEKSNNKVNNNEMLPSAYNKGVYDSDCVEVEQQSEQQVNNNCTTSEQQVNTNNNVNNDNNGINNKVNVMFDMVMSHLKSKMAPVTYNCWFNGLRLYGADGCNLYAITYNPLIAKTINENYKDLLTETVKEVYGNEYEIVVKE